MKRIFLTAAGLLALLHSFAQTKDSTGFQSRKLKVDEINLVSSYYKQDGDNAAVTGGIGSEKLTDLSNSISVKLIRYDKKQRKHSFDAELGIDHYTSASSDKIDLKANSSASHADTRLYPSVGWTMENTAKGNTFGAGLSFSTEFDYQSFGAHVSYSKKTNNRNGEFTGKLQAYFDRVSIILPTELRANPNNDDEDDYPSSSRNTFVASLSYSQIINERFQLAVMADVVQQQGYLSLPFHRVYFGDGSVHQEKLPDSRFKLPVGIRGSYFLGDKLIVRAYYRYYKDNWGLQSHTANIELPVKLSPFLSITPFYRYYKQTAVKYFAPWQEHTAQDNYYTSNYDLSAFNSHFFGAGFRLTPTEGIFGIKKLNMLELRYGHYSRSTNLNSDIISLQLRFK